MGEILQILDRCFLRFVHLRLAMEAFGKVTHFIAGQQTKANVQIVHGGN